MAARVGVVGATGYVGSEVVRWLLGRTDVEVVQVCSRRGGGRLDQAVPGLAGLCDLPLTAFDPSALAALDAVILATPHGAARPLAEALRDAPLVLDASSDHRHAPGWTYGMVGYADLRGASRIAVPGCFATALSLALAPLAQAGLLEGPVQVVGATGSTGSGAAPSEGTHHPLRFVNLKAYKVLEHQHVPEVRTFLAGFGRPAPQLHFVPLSAPLDRGILVTCFVQVPPGAPVRALYAEAAARVPLLRLREASPELRHVRGTGFCDLAVFHREDQGEAPWVILAALDNLGRGAAAQVVLGLEQALGLRSAVGVPPCTP